MSIKHDKTIQYRLEPTSDKKEFYLDLYRPYYDALDKETMVRYDSLKSLTRNELKQLANFINAFLEQNNESNS